MPSQKSIDYITIKAWMFSKDGLNLRNNELILYALVYSFSKDNKSYYASLKTAANWLGVSYVTVHNNLKKLTENGLLERTLLSKNGAAVNYKYVINKTVAKAAEKSFNLKNQNFEEDFTPQMPIKLNM